MEKIDLDKIYVDCPKIIKYGMMYPIYRKLGNLLILKFNASIKFMENPWPGKNSEQFLSARISGISETDLKALRGIKDAILSLKRLERYKSSAASFKLLQNGIIFAKHEKSGKIWSGDYLIDPPLNHEMQGEIEIRFQHVFIGANFNPHKSISCVLESFSWN